MFNVKISIPTYQVGSFGRLSQQGEVEISSEVNSLSEEYPHMKEQVDELLKQAGAENRLILDVEALEAKRAKMQHNLDCLQDNLKCAQKQLRRLENFLQRLGIDPQSHTYSLMINEDIALAATTDHAADVVVEAEVDPIPLNSGAGEEF